jgi:release factor glutamine methyltransferase
MTVAQALQLGTRRLAQAAVPTPGWDAELLLRHTLGWDRAQLLSRGRDPIPPDALETYLTQVSERARRRPLQHLTGTQAFWKHEFLVSPDVLIPRPETETLVEVVLELVSTAESPVIVDLGTGSGNLALSLAAERPDASVHAVDISPAAIAVATENARRLGLESRVRFHVGDLLRPVRDLRDRVDVIVSNPPYLDPAEQSSLQPEVRDHEPRVALLAPEGPLGLYARLVTESSALLPVGGWLALEVGAGMAADVAALCTDAGFDAPRVTPDLQAIPRVLAAQKHP